MTKSALSRVLRSKSLILVLVLGNVTLGLTTVAQDRIIEGQKHLIHLLYQDSAELALYKIAAKSAHRH